MGKQILNSLEDNTMGDDGKQKFQFYKNFKSQLIS